MYTYLEKHVWKNKIVFYLPMAVGLFVTIFGVIGGFSILIDDFSFWVGHALTYICISGLIMILILIYNKPDFKPRTTKKINIRNKTSKEVGDIISNWFGKNKFDVRNKNSNYFIGSKIINERVKYIFEIILEESKNSCNLTGNFYVRYNHNSKITKTSESSLSNKKFAVGSYYERPAWLLMEDLINNIQKE